MKITEMSDEQILALSEEQLDLMVKMECAEQGIPMEPKPPEQEFFELPKDQRAFQVSGTSIWLETQEAAEKLQKLLIELRPVTKEKQYDWRTGYDVEWLSQIDSHVEIETKLFYKKELVQERESFLVKRKTLKEQYESELKF